MVIHCVEEPMDTTEPSPRLDPKEEKKKREEEKRKKEEKAKYDALPENKKKVKHFINTLNN